MANIEEKVQDLIQTKVEQLGYELYDVEYAKEGKNYFLRIFIDKANGIDLNDCETVNDGIMELLDEADFIKEMYFLEVSSPGIERVLRKDKHLEANRGKQVEVKLFSAVEKKKQYIGILIDFNSNEIQLKIEDNKELKIDRKNISLLKTVYDWES